MHFLNEFWGLRVLSSFFILLAWSLNFFYNQGKQYKMITKPENPKARYTLRVGFQVFTFLHHFSLLTLVAKSCENMKTHF